MLVPRGFRFATAAAGFRKAGRDDLAVLYSTVPAAAAGVFTTNLFSAAPVLVARENLAASRTARAIVVNAGQANACTGVDGVVNCKISLELAAEALGLAPAEVLPASTGVIGAHLAMDKWRAAMPRITESLGQATALDAAKAILTTDSFPKLASARVAAGDGREARVLGLCKGAGMICPNMATMLGFLLTDAAVAPDLWQEIVAGCAAESFNRVTVDGDTSTNDCVLGLANGRSEVTVGRADMGPLVAAVDQVCQALAYMLVQDAEGGTKVARIEVQGAADDRDAELAARAVGNSPLVKTALFGRDPNWGRIAAALGRSGAQFDPDQVRIAIGGLVIFEHGLPRPGDLRALLGGTLRRQDIPIDISLGTGPGAYVLLASDLTYDYVKINAEYTT